MVTLKNFDAINDSFNHCFANFGGINSHVMKKIFVFLLILIAQTGQGQFNVGDVWVDNSMYDEGKTPGCVIHTTRNLRIEKDSTIDGKVYYQLTKKYREWQDYVGPNPQQCPGYDFFVPESPSWLFRMDEGKLVVRMDGQDEVAFDYNLNLGDTIKVNRFFNYGNAVVTQVDTVEINGVPRRRLWHSFDSYLLEGMGTSGGFLQEGERDFEARFTFDCFKSAAQQYTYPENGSCEASLGLENLVFEDLLVYPNPVNTILTIRLPKGEARLNLIDCLGNSIRSLQGISGTVDINTEDLPVGIYTLLVTVDESSYVQKVLKYNSNDIKR